MCVYLYTYTHTHTTHTTHTHQSRITRTQDQGSRERNWTGRRRSCSVDGEKPHRAKETYHRGKRDLLVGLRSFRAHRGSQVAHSQEYVLWWFSIVNIQGTDFWKNWVRNLSFVKQLLLFQNADAVIGPHGAGGPTFSRALCSKYTRALTFLNLGCRDAGDRMS